MLENDANLIQRTLSGDELAFASEVDFGAHAGVYKRKTGYVNKKEKT